MDEEITAVGGAFLFVSTRVLSLLCNSSSLYLIVHIQPAPIRGSHRVDKTREVIPNRDRFWQDGSYLDHSLGRSVASAICEAVRKHRAGLKM